MSQEEKFRFEAARQKVLAENRLKKGIGTLGEKTVHAVLKNYYEPDETRQEIKIEKYVADIYTGEEIIEIQSGNFNVLRNKLDCFLEKCPVSIVYPIPKTKWLIWIEEETGECSLKRKSPVKGNPYLAFKELYRIRQYLGHRNLRLKFVLLDIEEYRLLNGWSADKKKGSCRYDRIPVAFAEEISVERREDYMQFVPADLAEPFTSKEFAKAAHIKKSLAQTVLLILYDLDIVMRVGREGNSYLYEVTEAY